MIGMWRNMYRVEKEEEAEKEEEKEEEEETQEEGGDGKLEDRVERKRTS